MKNAIIKVFTMKKQFIFTFVLRMAMLFSACSPAKTADTFIATDITGAEFAKALSMTDHTGKRRTLSDFKGKAVSLFFVYTQCSIVCTITMFDLQIAMQ